MKRLLRDGVTAILLMACWAVLIFSGTRQGWWHRPITRAQGTEAYVDAAQQAIKAEFVGNLALAVIDGGEVVEETFHSVGQPVDRHTVFQVASLSKWLSAFGVMKLVEQGTLDLDAPAEQYLTRWHLPPSPFDHDSVTIRRLLSHTAGLTDGLGYSGFDSTTPVQTLEESLTLAADADEGVDGSVHVGQAPGSSFTYSGGGYTLLQLIVEEVTGLPFAQFMRDSIFVPLGLERSTYAWDNASGATLASFFESDGRPAPHYRYTSLAATSLYTSLGDLERLLQLLLPGRNGEPVGRGILQPATIRLMRTPHATTMGFDIWGLGTLLYAPVGEGEFIIGHDGRSTPPINTAVRFDPTTGDGVIVLETGSPLLATTLASEWVFWHTGKIDLPMFTMAVPGMKRAIVIGWLLILLGLVLYRITTREQPTCVP